MNPPPSTESAIPSRSWWYDFWVNGIASALALMLFFMIRGGVMAILPEDAEAVFNVTNSTAPGNYTLTNAAEAEWRFDFTNQVWTTNWGQYVMDYERQNKIQVGFRSDGLVVWRPATNLIIR